MPLLDDARDRGERYQGTLTYILVTPAGRLPLFLGRALPVILNAMLVSAFSLLCFGAPPRDRHPRLGVGADRARHLRVGVLLHRAGPGLRGDRLRVRETAVLNNVLFGLLLIFTGANIPLEQMPGWMEAIAVRVPLTHGIQAARDWRKGVPRERRRADRYRGRNRRRLRLHRLPAAPVHGARKPQTGIAGGGMSLLRLLYVGWLFNLKNLTLSGSSSSSRSSRR